MKISELIAELEEIQKEHGDLEVRTYNDEMDSYDDVNGLGIETKLGIDLFTGKKIFTDEFVAIN